MAYRIDITAVNTDTLAVVAARVAFIASADTRACAVCVDVDIAAIDRNGIRRAFAAAADTCSSGAVSV